MFKENLTKFMNNDVVAFKMLNEGISKTTDNYILPILYETQNHLANSYMIMFNEILNFIWYGSL